MVDEYTGPFMVSILYIGVTEMTFRQPRFVVYEGMVINHCFFYSIVLNSTLCFYSSSLFFSAVTLYYMVRVTVVFGADSNALFFFVLLVFLVGYHFFYSLQDENAIRQTFMYSSTVCEMRDSLHTILEVRCYTN